MSGGPAEPFRVSPQGPMLVLPTGAGDEERAEGDAVGDEDPRDHPERRRIDELT